MKESFEAQGQRATVPRCLIDATLLLGSIKALESLRAVVTPDRLSAMGDDQTQLSFAVVKLADPSDSIDYSLTARLFAQTSESGKQSATLAYPQS